MKHAARKTPARLEAEIAAALANHLGRARTTRRARFAPGDPNNEDFLRYLDDVNDPPRTELHRAAKADRSRSSHLDKPKKPKKIAKDIEAAVYASQLYIGKGLTMRISDEQKLYNSMNRKIASVAKRLGMDEGVAYYQIMNEAKRRGGILAMPGKDI